MFRKRSFQFTVKNLVYKNREWLGHIFLWGKSTKEGKVPVSISVSYWIYSKTWWILLTQCKQYNCSYFLTSFRIGFTFERKFHGTMTTASKGYWQIVEPKQMIWDIFHTFLTLITGPKNNHVEHVLGSFLTPA